MKIGNLKSLKVYYHNRPVGTLAISEDKQVLFEYDDGWLLNGFAISPLYLPLKKEVFIPKTNYFEGLFGVFSDSLPDAWGRMLLDRQLKKYSIKDINILDKLALIGNRSLGGLEYVPNYKIFEEITNDDFDVLNNKIKEIFNSREYDDIEDIFSMSCSLGGARPKVITTIHNEKWMVKFQSKYDPNNIAKMEYDYMSCAKECGISIPEVRLIQTKENTYYGIQCFNEKNGKKLHILTVSAILESDYRAPSLDYNDLMKLVRIITKENKDDLLDMFKRCCFNVFAHNLDDHAKNFSFYYDEDSNHYRLAPAYDLTYSNTYYGEHTTSINGKGNFITEEDLLKIATNAKINKNKALEIIEDIKKKVDNNLKHYF